MSRLDWRAVLARAPLPMLALAASYGVWSFNLLFVPAWVAFVSAAAFEGVYVGLAVARVSDAERRRAGVIAASAVAVSVLYNVASGLFHRRPELLLSPPLWLDALLAVMHGLPLAVVAYAVAALLLHAERQPERPEEGTHAPVGALAYARLAEPVSYPLPERVDGAFTASDVETPRKAHERQYTCKRCGAGPMPFSDLGRHSRKCEG